MRTIYAPFQAKTVKYCGLVFILRTKRFHYDRDTKTLVTPLHVSVINQIFSLSCWSLHYCVLFLDKKLRSTLPLFTQHYKWVNWKRITGGDAAHPRGAAILLVACSCYRRVGPLGSECNFTLPLTIIVIKQEISDDCNPTKWHASTSTDLS